MKESLKIENIDFLEQFYSEFNPRLSKVQYIGTISVFSFFFESEADLNDKWESVTSSIAVNYQSEFEEDEHEFERWNIYIFFLVEGSVSDQLKYKIENDKFSSRKIVQDNIDEALYPDSISELIKKNIVNSDLNKSILDENNASAKIPDYSSNSVIYRLVDDYHLNNSRRRAERGAHFVARKRGLRDANKEKLDSLYQQIIKEIKDEI